MEGDEKSPETLILNLNPDIVPLGENLSFSMDSSNEPSKHFLLEFTTFCPFIFLSPLQHVFLYITGLERIGKLVLRLKSGLFKNWLPCQLYRISSAEVSRIKEDVSSSSSSMQSEVERRCEDLFCSVLHFMGLSNLMGLKLSASRGSAILLEEGVGEEVSARGWRSIG